VADLMEVVGRRGCCGSGGRTKRLLFEGCDWTPGVNVEQPFFPRHLAPPE